MLSRQNRVAKSNLLVRLFSSSSSNGNGNGGPNDNGNNNKWPGDSVAVKIILEKAGSSSSSSTYGHSGSPKNDPLDAIFEQYVDPLGVARFRHFTLPGSVTTAESYKKLMVPAHSKIYPATDQLLFDSGNGEEGAAGAGGVGSPEQFQQMETVRHFGTANQQNQAFAVEKEGDEDDQSPLGVLSRVRCAAHECPVLVRKDFFDSFPEVNFKNQQQQKLSVVTIVEKSRDQSSSLNNRRKLNNEDNNDDGPLLIKQEILNNDDSSISSQKIDNFHAQTDFIVGDIQNNVDYIDSSEELKEQQQQQQFTSPTFINAAHEICKLLHAAGYWADFVDPFSGKLFSGDFRSNPTLLDTERALDRFAGVTVESSGACKVISHHATNQKRSRVGVVFTTASSDSPILKLIVAAQQEAEQQQRENNKENLAKGGAADESSSRGAGINNQSASTSSSDSHVTSTNRSDNRKSAVGGAALAILGKHY